MRILGIDPGLATIGLGLIEVQANLTLTAHEWLTIETSAKTDLAERLHEIEHDLCQYLTETRPDLAVIETLYFSRNEKTAIDVAQARGVILASVARQSIPILEPSPRELKSCITGDGSADKLQMQQMVQTIFHLDDIPKPDDAADALALAAFGAYQGKQAKLVC